MGDFWRDVKPELKQRSREKKGANLAFALEEMDARGIQYSTTDGVHFIVGEWNFWPTTGLFIHRQTNQRGRGIFNFLKQLS